MKFSYLFIVLMCILLIQQNEAFVGQIAKGVIKNIIKKGSQKSGKTWVEKIKNEPKSNRKPKQEKPLPPREK